MQISLYQYFINKQVEQEKSFVKHLDTLKFINENPHATMLFDEQLKSRVFVQPVIN